LKLREELKEKVVVSVLRSPPWKGRTAVRPWAKQLDEKLATAFARGSVELQTNWSGWGRGSGCRFVTLEGEKPGQE